jgi:hypothetical protein
MTRRRVACELLQRVRVCSVQRGALVIDPALELVAARNVESIQERPVVQIDRTFEIVRRDRALKLRDVAREELGVEPQLAHANDDLVVRASRRRAYSVWLNV